MRLMLVSITAGAALVASLAAAEAMPLQPAAAQASSGEIISVAGGCGPGFHRGFYGGCRRNFYRGYGYGYRRYGSQRYFYHNF